MALPKWVEGALRPSMLITWYREGTDDELEDLTGATLTGFMGVRHSSEAPVAIAGDLTVVNPAGQFRWDFVVDDVDAAGDYDVQFIATFESGQSPALTFVTEWTIERSL